MFTKIKNAIVALLLAGITIVGVYAYHAVDARLSAVDETLSSIVGQDATISAYYQMPNIHIAYYPERVDMGTMTPKEQRIFWDVLDAVAKREERVPYNGTVDELYSVITHSTLQWNC